MVEWWKDHTNVSALWTWLDGDGNAPFDGPAYFMEKPWKWNVEYDAYLVVEFDKQPLNSTYTEVLGWLAHNDYNIPAALADMAVHEN